ncbi:MAG TPA: hypothetical protein VKO43_01405, partial [Candidatus Krumholzibacteriaceae bacterium]|nr:hypothetical protein [Candidatus Krumholzibacteriaceae bacterium]
MKRIFTVLLCVAAISSCSGDSTGPEDDGNGFETEKFEASYTAETGMAESAALGKTGGNITATGPGGVEYALSIPAGALESDTLITVTPVSDLTVSGPGTFTCAS